MGRQDDNDKTTDTTTKAAPLVPDSKTATLAFLSEAVKCTTELHAAQVLGRWESLSCEAYWIEDGAPRARIAAMRAALKPWIESEKAEKAKKAAKAKGTKSPGKIAARYTVIVGVPGGPALASQGFQHALHAEEWGKRKLIQLTGDENAVALIKCPGGHEYTVPRFEAVRQSVKFDRHRPAMKVRTTSTSGPWMRVGNSKSAHSRG